MKKEKNPFFKLHKNGWGTPYSINSLFSELFRKFGEVFSEVFEIIWHVFWRCLGGFRQVWGGKNYLYLHSKTYKTLEEEKYYIYIYICIRIFKIFINILFTE